MLQILFATVSIAVMFVIHFDSFLLGCRATSLSSVSVKIVYSAFATMVCICPSWWLHREQFFVSSFFSPRFSSFSRALHMSAPIFRPFSCTIVWNIMPTTRGVWMVARPISMCLWWWRAGIFCSGIVQMKGCNTRKLLPGLYSLRLSSSSQN